MYLDVNVLDFSFTVSILVVMSTVLLAEGQSVSVPVNILPMGGPLAVLFFGQVQVGPVSSLLGCCNGNGVPTDTGRWLRLRKHPTDCQLLELIFGLEFRHFFSVLKIGLSHPIVIPPNYFQPLGDDTHWHEYSLARPSCRATVLGLHLLSPTGESPGLRCDRALSSTWIEASKL